MTRVHPDPMKMASYIPAVGLAALLALAPLPVAAQDQPEDGPSLIERGLMMLMDNVFSAIGPELDQVGEGMSGIVSRLGPALQDLAVLVDDIANYQTPERLENGDILIRRSPDAPPPPPIGENLRDLARPQPEDDARPAPPTDPTLPEIEL